VLASVDELRTQGFQISNGHIYEALEQITMLSGLQGRWQTLGNNPLIVCDTGHNLDGITWLLKQIESVPFNRLHMVIGFVKDKDVSAILQMLPETAIYYFTNAAIPRALDANKLANMAGEYGLHGSIFSTVKQAFDAAKTNASSNDFIFVGGSTFVVAEVV
jgi:dihydrofolate synthase / folylpolyglutamate synthase